MVTQSNLGVQGHRLNIRHLKHETWNMEADAFERPIVSRETYSTVPVKYLENN